MEIKCQLCGEGFEAKRCDAQFCPRCRPIKHREYSRRADAKRRFAGKCVDCGKPVGRKSIQGQGRCSSCARKGERNNFWKGGRYKSPHGYVYIYMPEHPRADKYHHRYVAEHQLVWEKGHNQPLPEGYIIHHLNGIKDDNRSENLVAIQPKCHSTRTRLELAEKRIRELECRLNNNIPTS